MFVDEMDSFLDTDEGAIDGTLNGNSVTVRFNDKWIDTEIDGISRSGVFPTAWGKETDFAGTHGTTAVFDGTSYTVVDIQPDGEGAAILVLAAQ